MFGTSARIPWILRSSFSQVFSAACIASGCAARLSPHIPPRRHFHIGGIAGKWNPLFKHLAYNFGRVLSYAFVGVFLGAVGGGFSGLKSIGALFSTTAGLLLIASGIWMMRIFPGMGFTRELPLAADAKSFLVNLYSKTYGALLSSPTIESKFYIGFLTPLLPCGLLYSAFIMAAASGSAVNGAMTMALFGLRHCSITYHCWICFDFFQV